MNAAEGHRVDLWFWSLAEHARDAESALSVAERDRARKRVDPRGFEKYVVARAGLRSVLGAYLGLAPGKLVFNENAFGKPHLQQRPSLRFSFSSSAELAVLAISETVEVGVDLERLADIDHLEVVEEYFAPQERAAVLSAPPSEQSLVFYKVWTLKEAVVKAVGTGLTTPLDAFEVSIAPPRLMVCPEDWGTADDWSLSLLAPREGYVCALAARCALARVAELWY